VTLRARVRGWTSAIRTFRIGLTASGLFGRSIKLRRAGRREEALRVAREGLSTLGAAGVNRHAPHAGACLLSLTIQVEQLAQELGEPGASWQDIIDSLQLLRALPEASSGAEAETRRAWLPYFEARVGDTGAVH